MVIIGLDPHPDTHTVVALDKNGKRLGTKTFVNNDEGLAALEQFSQSDPERQWAIEGAATAFIAPWVASLVAKGEHVVNIPPNLTSQYRNRRGSKKDDLIDAENAARALFANEDLSLYQPLSVQAELQQLSRNRERLAKQLKANRMALRSLGDSSVAEQALACAIKGLEQAIKALEQQLKRQVERLLPELLEQQGIGVVLAGVILAETANPARFETHDKFASYCGAAPVMRGSGRNMRAQVNPSGNRRLNRALHLIAQTRLRLDEDTQALRDKKLAEGKTPKATFRTLKTYIARQLFRLIKSHWQDSPEPLAINS